MSADVPRVDSAATHVGSLRRHFADLRDNSHGEAAGRPAKEAVFTTAVPLLRPYAVQALEEINQGLLLGEGTLNDSGLQRMDDGGLSAVWSLAWPAQASAKIPPIALIADYGANFHHPHLRGGTLGEWPLNVFTEDQARAELSVLRAIAEAELHNLVFLADYRIVPATMAHTPLRGPVHPVRLSILDQSPMTARQSPSEALTSSVERAQLAEDLGYERIWYAEHRGHKAFAGNDPLALAAAALDRTSHLNVGTGGVLIGFHDPDDVADRFTELDQLHPGRIDAGVGRANAPTTSTPRTCTVSPSGSADGDSDLGPGDGHAIGTDRYGPRCRLRLRPLLQAQRSPGCSRPQEPRAP